MFRFQEGFIIIANSEPCMNLVEQIRVGLLRDIYTVIFRRDFSQILKIPPGNWRRTMSLITWVATLSLLCPDRSHDFLTATTINYHASRKEILRLRKDVTMIPEGEQEPRRTRVDFQFCLGFFPNYYLFTVMTSVRGIFPELWIDCNFTCLLILCWLPCEYVYSLLQYQIPLQLFDSNGMVSVKLHQPSCRLRIAWKKKPLAHQAALGSAHVKGLVPATGLYN